VEPLGGGHYGHGPGKWNGRLNGELSRAAAIVWWQGNCGHMGEPGKGETDGVHRGLVLELLLADLGEVRKGPRPSLELAAARLAMVLLWGVGGVASGVSRRPLPLHGRSGEKLAREELGGGGRGSGR